MPQAPVADGQQQLSSVEAPSGVHQRHPHLSWNPHKGTRTRTHTMEKHTNTNNDNNIHAHAHTQHDKPLHITMNLKNTS